MVWPFSEKTVSVDEFGQMSRHGGSWIGRRECPLFPEIAVDIAFDSDDPGILELGVAHLRSLEKSALQIRTQIAEEAMEIYSLYSKEDSSGQEYQPIHDPNDLVEMMHPDRWIFPGMGGEYVSRLELRFDWPNDHLLVAYLNDDSLYELGVEG